MNADGYHPVVLATRSAVLLFFSVPPDIINRPQRAVLTALAQSIQTQLGSIIRVLRIDDASHPDVVQSFAITQRPAFVLVRGGVELWRQQGLLDEVTLVELIRGALRADADKNQPPT